MVVMLATMNYEHDDEYFCGVFGMPLHCGAHNSFSVALVEMPILSHCSLHSENKGINTFFKNHCAAFLFVVD